MKEKYFMKFYENNMHERLAKGKQLKLMMPRHIKNDPSNHIII